MNNVLKYKVSDFEEDIRFLANHIRNFGDNYDAIYGVPRGGVPIVIALSKELNIPLQEHSLFLINHHPKSKRILVVDDVIDSGNTRNLYSKHDFVCLHKKKNSIIKSDKQTFYAHNNIDCWIDYFWEENDSKPEDSVLRMLEYIGENPNREGLLETPNRVIKAWDYMFSGYKEKPEDLIKTFDSEGYDEIVLLKDIEFYSMCEHHALPFFGKAHIAYIPDKKVIGISKLARILDIYAKRLQIQERMGNQITGLLMEHLKPKGAACIIEAQHLCMKMRGVEKQNSVMSTSSLKGVFMDNVASREELMRLIK